MKVTYIGYRTQLLMFIFVSEKRLLNDGYTCGCYGRRSVRYFTAPVLMNSHDEFYVLSVVNLTIFKLFVYVSIAIRKIRFYYVVFYTAWLIFTLMKIIWKYSQNAGALCVAFLKRIFKYQINLNLKWINLIIKQLKCFITGFIFKMRRFKIACPPTCVYKFLEKMSEVISMALLYNVPGVIYFWKVLLSK